ncbi:MAG TPA: hypothetical protein VKE41_08415 [Roseiflexaceae bacterium]|nr:hypothetical protein [Roseiflexaceae bacterium]
MNKAMAGLTNPHTALVAYIEGLIGFMKIEPFALRAMIDIVMHGGFDYDADSEREAVSPISAILRWGQAEGIFRSFDIQVMATTIQAPWTVSRWHSRPIPISIWTPMRESWSNFLR